MSNDTDNTVVVVIALLLVDRARLQEEQNESIAALPVCDSDDCNNGTIAEIIVAAGCDSEPGENAKDAEILQSSCLTSIKL